MSRQAHHRQREITGKRSNIGRRCHRGKRYGNLSARDGCSGVTPKQPATSTLDPVTSPVPQIPPRFTDPRPVLAIGTLGFLIATIVVYATGDRWHEARPIVLMGLAVGVLGYTIFAIQRRGARRGDKGAQVGL